MVNLYEEIDGNYTGADFGYTNQSFPILGTNDEILTVTYYDNYHFDQGNILDYMRTYNSNDFLVFRDQLCS